MSRAFWLTEIHQILRLAVPLIIAHVAYIGMGIIDTMMAGQVSGEDLAGLAVGGNIWLILEVAMGGLLSAMTPRIARFYGAKRSEDITHETRQGLLLGLLAGILTLLVMLAMIPFIPLLGTEAKVTTVAQEYTQIIAYSLPASAVCWVLFCLIEAHGLMRFVVITSLIALSLNLLLDYLLVFGKLGLPALGGVGCAWTTTLLYWLWAVACIVYAVKHPRLRDYRIFAALPRFDWQRWRAILALGLPISLSLLAEEGFFSVSALLIAPLGTDALGAHQITIQLVAVVLMFGLGCGQATAIRVAHSIGRGQTQAVQQHIIAGLGLVVTSGLSFGLLVFGSRQILPELFTQDTAIVAISSTIMLLAPLYLVFDVLQIWTAQSLRGFEDTKVPMLVQITAYWLIGFPLGYSLGNTEFWGQSYGIYGFWIGFLGGIMVGGSLLACRLYYRLRLQPTCAVAV